MTNVKKILFLAFPLVIVLGGLVLFFDGTNTAVAATESFVYEGIDNAMNKFNRKMDD